MDAVRPHLRNAGLALVLALAAATVYLLLGVRDAAGL